MFSERTYVGQGCRNVYALSGDRRHYRCGHPVVHNHRCGNRKLLGANDLQAYGDGHISVLGGVLAELFFTCVFVFVVLGATAKTNGATNNFAGIAIGLSLVLVHLCCIRYTGTSVNPARSIGPALFAGGSALTNLWIFIVAPLAGGALAAVLWRVLQPDGK